MSDENSQNEHIDLNSQFRDFAILNDRSYQLIARKNWLKAKMSPDINREIISTLLTVDGRVQEECVERLEAADINFSDLAALTYKDLELIGYTNPVERSNLLNIFKKLPQQDPTYDAISDTIDSSTYNEEILSNATKHLQLMRNSFAGANYMLQISPPDDVLVGEKSFASRFVVEALKELKSVPDGIDKELDELHMLMRGDSTFLNAQKMRRKKKKSTADSNWIWRFSVATCVVAAFFIWKSKIL